MYRNKNEIPINAINNFHRQIQLKTAEILTLCLNNHRISRSRASISSFPTNTVTILRSIGCNKCVEGNSPHPLGAPILPPVIARIK